MKTFELYAKDLTEEAQKQLCECAGIKDISEANWDYFPITTIDFEDEEVELIEEDTNEDEDEYTEVNDG